MPRKQPDLWIIPEEATYFNRYNGYLDIPVGDYVRYTTSRGNRVYLVCKPNPQKPEEEELDCDKFCTLGTCYPEMGCGSLRCSKDSRSDHQYVKYVEVEENKIQNLMNLHKIYLK